jgi:hypothetical protein
LRSAFLWWQKAFKVLYKMWVAKSRVRSFVMTKEFQGFAINTCWSGFGSIGFLICFPLLVSHLGF